MSTLLVKIPPGKGIVVPAIPLRGDHTFAELSRIAGQLDEAIDKTNCVGTKVPSRLNQVCLTILETQAGVLVRFDAWLAQPAPYKLERPANLDRHSRVPLAVELTATQPDLIRFKRLATLLAFRSLNRLGARQVTLAKQDLHTVFSLGDFFQQNPSLRSQFLGNRMYDTALLVLVRHIPLVATDESVEDMLPVPQHILDGASLAIGETWLGVHDLFERELSSLSATLSAALGWYTSEYALRLMDRCFFRPGLTHLASGRLGSSFRKSMPPGCDWDDMWFVKWFHQPISRILVSTAGPGYDIEAFNARSGQTIDRVQATRVVIAARKFWRQNGHWPSHESDLVPAYLKEWPTSVLDGQPIRWMDGKNGLFILGRDGRSGCQAEEFCQFPFEPPDPIGGN